MKAHDLDIIGAGESESLQLGGSGATIELFDTDTSLTADSDTRVPTQKAVKAYVDGATPAGNLISQLDSKVEVTDTGANGQIEIVTDNNSAVLIKEPTNETEYNMVITNNGHVGGALKLILDDHTLSGDFYAMEISLDSAVTTGDATLIEGLELYVHQAVPAGGDGVDVYGAFIGNYTNGTGHYSTFYGVCAFASVGTAADVDYAYGGSFTGEQKSGGSAASDSIIGVQGRAYIIGSGLVTDAKAADNFAFADPSTNVTNLYGEFTQVNVANLATVGDVYLDRMQFVGTGAPSGDVWGIYVEGADKNYMEGELNVLVDSTSLITVTTDGLMLQSGTAIKKFSTDNTFAEDSDDIVPTQKAIKAYIASQLV